MNLDITEAGQFETEVKAGNQTESDIRTLALTLLIKKGEAMKMPQQGGDRSRRNRGSMRWKACLVAPQAHQLQPQHQVENTRCVTWFRYGPPSCWRWSFGVTVVFVHFTAIMILLLQDLLWKTLIRFSSSKIHFQHNSAIIPLFSCMRQVASFANPGCDGDLSATRGGDKSHKFVWWMFHTGSAYKSPSQKFHVYL